MESVAVRLRGEAHQVLELVASSGLDQALLDRGCELLDGLIKNGLMREAERLAHRLRSASTMHGLSPTDGQALTIVYALTWDGVVEEYRAEVDRIRARVLDCPESTCTADLVRSWLAYRSGEYALGIQIAKGCYDSAQARANFWQMGRAAFSVAMCLLRGGDSSVAQLRFQESAVLQRLAGYPAGEAAATGNQAICLKNMMAWGASKFFVRRALDICAAECLDSASPGPRLTLGIVEFKSGHLTDAVSAVQTALETYARYGDKAGMLSCSLALSQNRILTGHHRIAARDLEKAQASAAELGLSRHKALAYEFLGDLYLEQGKAKAALAEYDQALEIGMRIAPRGDVVAEAERRRADALVQLGRLEEAARALEHGEEVAAAIPEPYETAVMSRVRLSLVAANGTRDAIEAAYRVAREKVWAMDEKIQRARLLETWAFVLGAWEEQAQRREVLYEARNYYGAVGATGCFERVTRKLAMERMTEGEDGTRPRFRCGMVVAHASTARHLDLLERYRTAQLPVLILGETGTGKELIARAAHETSGGRGPWVAVNCGAMPRELVESELFGVVRGAYTGAVADRPGVFERAHGGTLFLDEVGELPLGAQTRLLRALESGEVCRIGDGLIRKVKFRLVAATHRDLKAGVREGWFRGDLYYRLEGLVLEVLPLRERRDEIEHLARHFMGELEHQLGRSILVDSRFWDALRSRDWPGNVRQLKRAVERAVLGLEPDELLRAEHLDEGPESRIVQKLESQDLERDRVVRALSRCNWNKTAACALLGMKRTTLVTLMKRIGVPLKRPE
jgi:DNA-binding NtrC family response regulator/tetratricopeptide (TPR) repeat protein